MTAMTDENGKPSMARRLIFWLFILCVVVVLGDLGGQLYGREMVPPYTFLLTLTGTFAAWAGLPRVVANAKGG